MTNDSILSGDVEIVTFPSILAGATVLLPTGKILVVLTTAMLNKTNATAANSPDIARRLINVCSPCKASGY